MKIDISPSLGRVSHDVAPTPAASLTNLQALAQQAVATGLDRPGKSVNAIRPNDPESETNRVLIKFTMPMPEIKGDNEDDEVEMPTGLPMSVPMYVDVPAGSAPDSAGTVLDAAVDAGDARGAALTRVPPMPAATPVRSIDPMVPSTTTLQTGPHAARRARPVETPSPADATRRSVASISPRPRAFSTTPSVQGSSSSHGIARGMAFRTPDMPAREGVRSQTRAPLHATSMPAVGHGEQIPAALRRHTAPPTHEAATRAVGRGEPRAPLEAAVRPQTDTAIQARGHVEPRGPIIDTAKRPANTATHATTTQAAGQVEPHRPIIDTAKRPANTATHAITTQAAGQVEPHGPIIDAAKRPANTATHATTTQVAGQVEPHGPIIDTAKRPASTATHATTTQVAGQVEPHGPIIDTAKRPANTATHATTMHLADHGDLRAPARLRPAPVASTETLAAPYRDSADPLPGSRDADGPRHRIHAPADAPVLTPWMTSEQVPNRPSEQQSQASRPSTSPAAFGGEATQPPATDSVTATAKADTAPKDHFEMTYRFSSWGPQAFVKVEVQHLRPDAQMVATASDEHVHHILHTALRGPMLEKNGDPSLRLTDIAVESSTERGQKRGRRQR
ncbi:SpaN/EivJ family type III secretion system needle length determinant [Achromobacter xylosoxidans]